MLAFLYLFHPQITVLEKDSTQRLWVSLRMKKDSVPFLPYQDSWKNFKSRYFVFSYVGSGIPWFRTAEGPKFPLHWSDAFYVQFAQAKEWIPRFNQLSAEERKIVDDFRIRLDIDGPFPINRIMHIPSEDVRAELGTSAFFF